MQLQVGVIELTSKYRYGLTSRGVPLYLFKSYDPDSPDLIVGSSERDLSRNQIAIVEVPAESKHLDRGSLQRLIGPVGDFAAEKEALMLHYAGSVRHKTAEAEVDTSDDENRIPISAETGWVTFHIDPPGCRDVDDAISYHKESRTWAITIADAAAAVPVDSPIDQAAKAIGATFYDLEGRALKPMLPPAISEASASLLPGEPRRGITLFLKPQPVFQMTWVTVDFSFTYESFTRSELAYDLHVSKDAHEWIEELMIRYNREVAGLLKNTNSGLLRVQPETEETPIWARIDPALKFLAAEAASYEAATPDMPQTHASLGLYCHASSPLRRYADLVNQRTLKAIIRGDSPVITDIAEHLNLRSKANKRWSRDLTFLTHVTPGRVHTIDVVWLSAEKVWISAWKRIIRLRHEEVRPVGYIGPIQIFCDPTKRNWKDRILTNSVS